MNDSTVSMPSTGRRFANAKWMMAVGCMMSAAFLLSGHLSLIDVSSSMKNSIRRRLMIAESIDRSSPNAPGLALMMGFPWSGQKFLQRAVHDTTGTTTGMNYGIAVMKPDGTFIHDAVDSVPVYANRVNGPYALSTSHPFPQEGYVLTRSYCAGHCTFCWPQEYVKTRESFFHECHTGDRFQSGQETQVFYDPALVSKYIHLVRNPLTNIAARFEHEYDRYEMLGKVWWMKTYPTGKVGFQKWCHEFDDNWIDGRRFFKEKSYYITDPEIEALAKAVPCHTDFFRIVQWHNHAFAISKVELANKPMKLIYYEDIVKDQKGVVDDLLQYLELTKKFSGFAPLEEEAHSPPYYESEQVEAIKNYVKRLATEDTWAHLSRYFS